MSCAYFDKSDEVVIERPSVYFVLVLLKGKGEENAIVKARPRGVCQYLLRVVDTPNGVRMLQISSVMSRFWVN